MMSIIGNIKKAGGSGFLIVTDNMEFAKNHCRMYDDNSFFTGVMTLKNFKILEKQTGKHIYGTLNIELKDSKAKLL